MGLDSPSTSCDPCAQTLAVKAVLRVNSLGRPQLPERTCCWPSNKLSGGGRGGGEELMTRSRTAATDSASIITRANVFNGRTVCTFCAL